MNRIIAKTNRNKAVFLSWLSQHEGAVSADDLYITMRNGGVKTSISTVYKYLYLLQKDGVVQIIRPDDKRILFYRV